MKTHIGTQTKDRHIQAQTHRDTHRQTTTCRQTNMHRHNTQTYIDKPHVIEFTEGQNAHESEPQKLIAINVGLLGTWGLRHPLIDKY